MLFMESVLEEAAVRAALDELVARKQAGEELAVAPPVEVLSHFIERELPRLEALNEPDDAAGDVEELNGFFRRYALAVRATHPTPSRDTLRAASSFGKCESGQRHSGARCGASAGDECECRLTFRRHRSG